MSNLQWRAGKRLIYFDINSEGIFKSVINDRETGNECY